MRPWDPVVPAESSLNEVFSLLKMVVLNIVSLNVFGLRNSGKQAGLIHWIRSLPSSPEIVCLQEMHCISSEEAQAWFAASGFSVAVSPGSVRSCGCVLLFRPLLCFLLFPWIRRVAFWSVPPNSLIPSFAWSRCMLLTATLLGTFSSTMCLPRWIQ